MTAYYTSDEAYQARSDIYRAFNCAAKCQIILRHTTNPEFLALLAARLSAYFDRVLHPRRDWALAGEYLISRLGKDEPMSWQDITTKAEQEDISAYILRNARRRLEAAIANEIVRDIANGNDQIPKPIAE